MADGAPSWQPPSRRTFSQSKFPAALEHGGVLGPPRLAFPSGVSHPRFVLQRHLKATRAQKAATRQRELAASGETSEGYVRRRTVGAQTRALYTKVAGPILRTLTGQGISRTDVAAFDLVMDGALHKLFFEGGSI